MVKLLVVILVVFLLLSTVEYLRRDKLSSSEYTRKFIHISVGSFVAFWPYFLSWRQIELLATAFFVVILISRTQTIFSSIHSVGRKTFGELLFAAVIGISAMITHNHLIFTIAILHLSLADGLAAVVGMKYGKKQSYKVLGHHKSIPGTATFWICSVILLSVYFAISHATGFLPTIFWLPVLAALLENIGIYGTDNLLVPMIVLIALRY